MEHSATDFARTLGVAPGALPETCRGLIENTDFTYEEPSLQRRDEILLGVIKHIDSDAPTRVGQQREDVWERCWAENLGNFVASEHICTLEVCSCWGNTTCTSGIPDAEKNLARFSFTFSGSSPVL